ncbi:MAG TPA: hypothetical protein VMF06_18005 [Candidatus Limnocylindria bacterium]|nr:hypothetical protein [Candidatus Limnocylindria bacterium]
MKKFAFTLAAALLGVAGTGCYKTQVGNYNMGVPFSSDTIESRYERPLTEVIAAAKATLIYNGTLTSEDSINHLLSAKIDNRTVWIRADPVEANISRIYVQVRKSSGSGDIHLASELDKQIALRLK